ncbi:MAG: hypothetical protein KF690_03460 [Bacteroidetes bacterium]|nr:hypothetical protein [Bacteroidota bacterium]
MEFWSGVKWISVCTTIPPCSPPPTPVAGSNAPICEGQLLNLTATPVAGATHVWTGPNGFHSTAQNPAIPSATVAMAGNYTVRTWLMGCYSDPDTVSVAVTPHGQYRSCRQILIQNPGSPSGVYTIDLDSLGPLCPMPCYCDMATDGGGWTLVLNYNHLGGTKPALMLRTGSFPLLGSTVLGVDESGTDTWGHIVPSLASQFTDATEFRLYGISSHHTRMLHVKSSLTNCLSYLKTGTGSCSGLHASFTPLAGHTSTLPGSAANIYGANAGNLAMTEHLFYTNVTAHWNIDGGACGDDRWEIDDCTAFCSGAGACTSDRRGLYDTHHQVWFR